MTAAGREQPRVLVTIDGTDGKQDVLDLPARIWESVVARMHSGPLFVTINDPDGADLWLAPQQIVRLRVERQPRV